MAGPTANEKHKARLRELRQELADHLATETDPAKKAKLQHGIDKIDSVLKKGFDPVTIIAIIEMIVQLLKLFFPKKT